MHTEVEAKTKMCPYFGGSVLVQLGCMAIAGIMNKDIEDQAKKTCHCIASDCMMWRWKEYRGENRDGKSVAVPIIESGGYCGIGGIHD
jgi:hypothetical protein